MERPHLLSYEQVAYQQILQLTYVDDLLAAMREVFVKLFAPFIITFVQSLRATGAADSKRAPTKATWDFSSTLAGWNDIFDKLLRGFEAKAAQVSGAVAQAAALLRVYLSLIYRPGSTGAKIKSQSSASHYADAHSAFRRS